MNLSEWQTPAALGVVILALLGLIISAKKKKHSCGSGDCACPTNLKKKK